jgi:hypothetical protein
MSTLNFGPVSATSPVESRMAPILIDSAVVAFFAEPPPFPHPSRLSRHGVIFLLFQLFLDECEFAILIRQTELRGKVE